MSNDSRAIRMIAFRPLPRNDLAPTGTALALPDESVVRDLLREITRELEDRAVKRRVLGWQEREYDFAVRNGVVIGYLVMVR